MRRVLKRVQRLALSVVLVLAVLAAVAVFGLVARSNPPGSPDGPGSEPLRVNTYAVKWEAGYTVERRFVGRVEARRSSDLGFEVAGMVLEVLVEEGQSVETGQVIARLDTQRLKAREAELIAARNQAQADYELAKTTRDRVRNTAGQGAATQQEIDNVERAYLAASASLEQSRAAVSTIGVEIEKAEITSPFAAVVAERYVDEGNVIGSGTPVVRLLERRDPEVRLGVGGNLIDQVQVGQAFDAMIRGRKVNGVVTSILPTRESQARGVDVLIRLNSELDGVRQGDLARVAIPRQIEEQGFWVPTQALTEGVRGLWSLYLIEDIGESEADAVLKRVDVEVLHTQGDTVYVRGALDNQSLVVADGLQRVAPGMIVRKGGPVDAQRLATGGAR